MKVIVETNNRDAMTALSDFLHSDKRFSSVIIKEKDDWGLPGMPLSDDAIAQAVSEGRSSDSVSSNKARQTTRQRITQWRDSL